MSVALAPDLDSEGPANPLLPELFRPTGVDGVYARTGLYEQVVEAVGGLITRYREPNAEVFRFPPVMSRRVLERSGYLRSFPHLLGCVSCLEGSDAEISRAIDRFEGGGEWTDVLAPIDLVLSPATCYPIYPLAAQRGAVPPGGLLFDVGGDCFRHEPSRAVDRLQSFRMREFVCIGALDQVAKFRAHWMRRMADIADELQLSHRVAPASDPFFGRAGTFMAKAQIDQSLKFEALIRIGKSDQPTACMSLNYHRDHFSSVWDLRNEGGEVSHSGCMAFGMDRLAVALFATHGLDLTDWPTALRAVLRLEV
jgi:seryl-tRNA synthetase